MKLISAIIRETKLNEVREALIESGISRITVVRVSGHGQQTNEEIYRGKKVVPSLVAKVKIEIAVNDDYVDPTVTCIINTAKTSDSGEMGDGKVWITNIEDCIRIRTSERGNSAI